MSPPPHHFQRLPFFVGPATTDEHFQQVLELRYQAYGRHDYEADLQQSMKTPDSVDISGYSTTLVAVCKETGLVLGTVRLTSSLDTEIDWPEGVPLDDVALKGAYTYIDRFAAHDSATALVAEALIKGIYLWSRARDSEYGAALALPALARVYARKGGMTIKEGLRVAMPAYHRAPYCFLTARTDDVREILQNKNPLFSKEFFNRAHPDICVTAWPRPWSRLIEQNTLARAA